MSGRARGRRARGSGPARTGTGSGSGTRPAVAGVRLPLGALPGRAGPAAGAVRGRGARGGHGAAPWCLPAVPGQLLYVRDCGNPASAGTGALLCHHSLLAGF